MATVSSIADFAAQINASSKPVSTSASQGTQDQFLAMLTAQMKNQDPMNPLQNSDVTSQLAQLKMVDGISQLNTSISAMNEMFAENRALQAASLVGRGVLAPGDAMTLAQGKALGGVDLAQTVDNLQISITDASGKVLQSMDMGPQNAGVLTFSWDGLDADGVAQTDGQYYFQVKASAAGKAVEATELGFTSVASVSLNGQQLAINTTTLGTVNLSQVKEIY